MELHRRQVPPRSLAAFELSNYADDWRDLMRLYLVRRTRSFIHENYAHPSARPAEPWSLQPRACGNCGRAKTKAEHRFLTFADGRRSYFPTRVPRP